MSRQLCHVCQCLPIGADEKQGYSIGVPEDGNRFELPLCMICLIFICQAVREKTLPEGATFKPIHQAIEDAKAAYERGRKVRST